MPRALYPKATDVPPNVEIEDAKDCKQIRGEKDMKENNFGQFLTVICSRKKLRTLDTN